MVNDFAGRLATIDSFQRHQTPFSRSEWLVFNSTLVVNPMNMLLIVVLDIEVLTLRYQRSRARLSPGALAPFFVMMNSGLANRRWWTYIYRMLEENFDRQLSRMRSHFVRQDKTLNELTEKMRTTNQRLADL